MMGLETERPKGLRVVRSGKQPEALTLDEWS